MYKSGTLITLKDGDVYRTSRWVKWACNECRKFYSDNNKPTPCVKQKNPFGSIYILSCLLKCGKLYGEHRFPKLVTLCGNQDKL